ncbi:CRISPR-associated protein Csx16 [Melaminivora suipulveris]|uniref:CRISPR-associated protein Csx16 n=1 Tax=Melaminivora suipulveris TaxID=2109913 RepID=A0A2R3QBU8_9BURK|nr:CRISPR-associated protein Csx16 [Melaminivora suipulveris]AVO49256.1 CRISPR-associated protein Csx16 [Melaminivora suipulveris]
MTTWFVSRHPGALQWMRQHGPAFDQHVPHLDPAQVHPGDRVLGTLPVHLAAQVCARRAEYWHLVLDLPEAARGHELGAHELTALRARLQRFFIYPHHVPQP